MRTLLLQLSTRPHPCPRCGTLVRTVETVDGRPLTITDTPSPQGDIIPWPNEQPTGLAQARRVTTPVTDGPMWEEHRCDYT